MRYGEAAAPGEASAVAAIDQVPPQRPARWMTVAAVGATGTSITVVTAVGAMGPSAAVSRFPSAAPWPPWFWPARPSAVLVSLLVWAAVLLGAAGLVTGLVAVRRGWRPRPSRLIAGSTVAVLALLVIPPVGSTDMLDYAAYGRIAALGLSPYQMTPLQLKARGDPVGAVAPRSWETYPSVYGPLATASQWAAAELAGASAARTQFWLKVWNGLAYLAVVFGLDRLARSDPARRTRVHLLWSVNALMLIPIMAGGHVDVIGAAFVLGAVAVLGPGAVCRRGSLRWLAAGLLAGAAAATKAPFLLVGAGLGWTALRSPRNLVFLGLGMLAVLVPGYLLAGWPAVAAVAGPAPRVPTADEPWQLLSYVLRFTLSSSEVNLIGAVGFVILAVIMLRRAPEGTAYSTCVAPAFAVMAAWLATTPHQHPWFDAAVYPLLALLPATRLEWVVAAGTLAAALADLPGVFFYLRLSPRWLSATGEVITTGVAPLVLATAGLVLLWLYASGRWRGTPGPRTVR